jgi:TonB family protein
LRNRAYPDFESIPQAPGTTSWSMVGYDLAESGRPVRLRTLEGSGNAALDRAAVEAVAQSRFWTGGRTGCLYPYYRRGPILVAPPMPEAASVRPTGATCPAETGWDRKPVLRYPEPYRRRSTEGWALIAFDVAPWGQTGNVRVLAAEPAAAFGDYGKRVIESATKPKSTAGYVGCVERVRFAMGGGEQGRLAEEATPPPPF